MGEVTGNELNDMVAAIENVGEALQGMAAGDYVSPRFCRALASRIKVEIQILQEVVAALESGK